MNPNFPNIFQHCLPHFQGSILSFRDQPRLRCLHVQPAPTAVPRVEVRWAHQPRLRRLILRRLHDQSRAECRQQYVGYSDHLMPRLRVNCADFYRRAVVQLRVRRQHLPRQEGGVCAASALRAGAFGSQQLRADWWETALVYMCIPIATIHPPSPNPHSHIP